MISDWFMYNEVHSTSTETACFVIWKIVLHIAYMIDALLASCQTSKGIPPSFPYPSGGAIEYIDRAACFLFVPFYPLSFPIICCHIPLAALLNFSNTLS